MTLALSAACVVLLSLLAVVVLKKHPLANPAAGPPASAASETASDAASPVPRAAAGKVAPSPAVAAPIRPVAGARMKADAGAAPDEESLLSRLHELAASDPNLSLKLAREAVKRFPDGPNAPEFEWNVVKALFNMGRLDEAKAEARSMLSKYPGNYFTGDVVHHLLNPPPNPPEIQ